MSQGLFPAWLEVGYQYYLRSLLRIVKETNTSPSLLPYLLPGRGKICLRLQTTGLENSSSVFPYTNFVQINDLDPLARIFKGSFVTDYGSILKEVNLLIQRDSLQPQMSEEIGLNNATIDHYWQAAMRLRMERTPDHSNLLAVQVGDQGQLLPFAPLLYCCSQKLFFEPPCPSCGRLLELCKDDDLLIASGLKAYSSSCHRYLWCPSCSQGDNKKQWYTLQRALDDPSSVSDGQTLLFNIGELKQKSKKDIVTGTQLPCLTCQQNDLCFGAERKVYLFLSVFSFYPFFMLINNRDSIDGFHFLSLMEKHMPLAAAEKIPTPSIKASETHVERKTDNDPAILSILQNLGRKWQQEALQPQPFDRKKGKDIPPEETATTKTLPIKDKPPVQSGALDETLPIGNTNSELTDLSQETVIISSSEDISLEKDFIESQETVVIPESSGFAKGSAPPDINEYVGEDVSKVLEDDLAETVILKPGEKP